MNTVNIFICNKGKFIQDIRNEELKNAVNVPSQKQYHSTLDQLSKRQKKRDIYFEKKLDEISHILCYEENRNVLSNFLQKCDGDVTMAVSMYLGANIK
jgi:hypothetical protein